MSKYISELSTSPSSRPLFLDELRRMEGCPVWVKVIDHSVFKDPKDDFDGWGMVRKSWVRIWDEKRADLIHIDYDFESYGKEWMAYAMPVKFGQWEYDSEKDIYFCSECKQESSGNCNDCTSYLSNFCPNCGTMMVQDGESCVQSEPVCEHVYRCGENRANYASEGGSTDV